MKIKNEIDLQNSNTNRFNKFLKRIQKRTVTVGIHKKDNKRYPKSEVTTAEVGRFQEFGTIKLPPRMWIRIFNVLTAEKEALKKQIDREFKKTINPDKFLKGIGKYQKERIRGRILRNGVTPPSDNKTGITLVDTGQLVNSIDYEVH